jgi:magnesium transporter
MLATRSTTADPVPMVANCVAYHVDGTRIGDISLDEISDVLAKPDTFVWVGLVEPDEDLLEKLQEEFCLHDLAIEDAHNAHQRPKIEAYGDSLFIVAQTAQVVSGSIEFGETHIFVGKRYLVTVRPRGIAVVCAGATQLRAVAGHAQLRFRAMRCIRCSTSSSTISCRSCAASRKTCRSWRKTSSKTLSSARTHPPLVQPEEGNWSPCALAIGPTAGHPSTNSPACSRGLIRDEVRPYFRDVYDHAARINESHGTPCAKC